MAVTQATLIVRFPELANMPVDQVTEIIADVVAELDSGQAFGDAADRAVSYLAAHYLALLKLAQRGAAGPVSSESKSENGKGGGKATNVSYKTPSGSDMLSQTVYGQLFKRLAASATVDVIAFVCA